LVVDWFWYRQEEEEDGGERVVGGGRWRVEIAMGLRNAGLERDEIAVVMLVQWKEDEEGSSEASRREMKSRGFLEIFRFEEKDKVHSS
jgi:hypothetical protein